MRGPKAADGERWFALDLANSNGCAACGGGDALASVAEARRWVGRRLPGEAAPRNLEELRSLRHFRNLLRQLMQAGADRGPPARTSLDRVNRAAADLPSYPELGWSHGRWTLTERGRDPVTARRLEALAARSAITLMAGPRPAAIRRCAGPGCTHFLAARTRQQRWCSPTGCGNRVRVQRHYRKLRSLRRSGAPRTRPRRLERQA